jgi:hypothetical protein
MNSPISSVVGGTRKELVNWTWEEYIAFPALNGSVLAKARVADAISMKHLLHAWEQGSEDTDALRFGRLVHCLLLEPKEVEKRYWTWEGRRAGNDYKLRCKEAAAVGAELVKATGQYSMERALPLAHEVLANPEVQKLIKAGQREQAVLCPELGMQCKGRLDWVSTSEHVLMDVKTAANIEGLALGRSFFSFRYDIKLGLYQRWLNAVTNDRWPVVMVAVESDPPHDVLPVVVPDAVLDHGVDKAMAILQGVRRAIETNEWPGIAGNGYYPLRIPAWEMDEAEKLEPFEG